MYNIDIDRFRIHKGLQKDNTFISVGIEKTANVL